MKKTISLLIFVYAISLIAAVLLLIFESRISEDSYLIARLLLFGYSILTSTPLFLPGFTACLVWLLKKIFKIAVANPDDYLEDVIYWWIIVVIILLLGVFFKMTSIIPIIIIIRSSYLVFKLVIIYKTLSLTNPQE